MKTKSIIILILLTIIVNFKLLKAPFIYDDRSIITMNKNIQNFNNITKIFSKDYYNITAETSFRPLASFFHFVNYAIWGKKVVGFRIVELFIYVIVVILVYFVGLKLFNHQTVAFVSTLIFAVHPVHAETLGCISLAYGELLCTLFILLAFLYHLKTIEQTNPDNIVLTFVFWILALLSKETAIVFPVFVFVHLLSRQILKTKKVRYLLISYLVISFIYLCIRFLVFKITELKYVFYIGGNFYHNFLTMSYVLLQYLTLLVLPLKLAVEPQSVISYTIFNSYSILGITTVVCIIILFILLIKQKKWTVLIALSWIVFPLVPAMNLIPFLKAVLLNIRYLFIPSIGFCWLLGLLFAKLNLQKLVVKVILVFLIISFSIRTIVRTSDWTDEIRLWQKNIKLYPDFIRPRLQLAGVYIYSNRVEKAKEEYQKIINIAPTEPDAYYNLGVITEFSGDVQGAITLYKKAEELIKNYPKDAPQLFPITKNVYLSLAEIYEKQNNSPQALYYFKQIGMENIFLGRQHYKTGNKLITEKKYDEAFCEFSKATKLNPQNIDTALELARIYSNKKMFNEAIECYEKSLELTPENISVLYELSKLLYEEKEYEKAIKYFTKIAELNPNDVNAYNCIAVCYWELKNYKKAKRILETALTKNPENQMAIRNYKKITEFLNKKEEKKNVE